MAEESAEGRWRPLRVRQAGGKAVVDYEALHEGVPPWLMESLTAWVAGFFMGARGRWDADRLRQLERELRLPLAWNDDPGNTLLADLQRDEDLFLDVVDYLLRDLRWFANQPNYQLRSVVDMLKEAGSAWEVTRDGRGFRLQRRVLEVVAASARQVFEVKGAGDHLRKAWAAAYGRQPDPSRAYSEAVKAVEAAAQPIVTPKDPKSTLGKMIPVLRDAPAKWEVVLVARPDFDRVAVVQFMAELLWQGQTDRHGTPSPVPVSQEQAEAAVHLAALLVQWFTGGSIRRST